LFNRYTGPDMKKTLFTLLMVSLVGCTGDGNAKPELPDGLKDCSVFKLEYGAVFRCPNSSISTQMTGTKVMYGAMVDSPNDCAHRSEYRYDTMYTKYDGDILVRRVSRTNYDTLYIGKAN
jgi:hypothetical protein